MSETVKSAARVFEILEFFAAVRMPRRVRDVATQLRYPLSSTAALLKSMKASGYLAFEAKTRTYFPTVRLFQLTTRLHALLRPISGGAPGVGGPPTQKPQNPRLFRSEI